MDIETRKACQALGELTDKVAVELVFAEVGKDTGLLPLNHFIGQILEICDAEPSLNVILDSAKSAQGWLDRVFDQSGLFDAASIEKFRGWTAWMANALGALQRDENVPPFSMSKAQAEPAVPARTASETPARAEGQCPPPDAEAYVLELNMSRDADLLVEFCNESQEHLLNIETGMLALESNPDDTDTLNSIFRSFHTIKGNSGFLNLTPVNRLAHQLESLLDLARQGKLRLTVQKTETILAGKDILADLVKAIEARITGRGRDGPVMAAPMGPVLHKIQEAIAGTAAPGAPQAPAESVAGEPLPAQPAPARDTSELPTSAPSTAGKPGQARGQASSNTGKGASSALVVKVDSQKLDTLLDLVGELVIAQSLVAQSPALQAVDEPALAQTLSQLGRITSDLQKSAMALRLVPIRACFQKMNRLVRDLAHAQGKEIELATSGEETELDRTIIEQINDPLMHMIRNAVDHGIETPEARTRNGKPRAGTIHLRAFHRAGAVVVEIQDDGAGLDKERILAKAVEKGLAQPGCQLEEKDIFQFIFAPGFSTAQRVSEISGRGVGMDVVRRNIQNLGGKVEIQSIRGQGSTFSVFLPLTLAIIDGLIVGVGEHRFIIPTLSVRESFQPARGMISVINGRGEVLNVRGRLSPMLRLYDYLNIPPTSTDPTEGIVMSVEAGNETRCVLVDRLLGKQEVVIKGLGDTFKSNRAFAGATILGDGRVGLILDPNALVRLKSATFADAA